MSLADLRREYRKGGLHEGDVDRDPMQQFGRWFHEALDAGFEDVNGMFLATADADGTPSARVVLLKGFDGRGFVFYTNYDSRKARALDATGRAELVWYWAPLERQIRAAGPVERVSAEESDAYFATRPRPAQIGAWASPQSEVIPDRAALEQAYRAAEQRFGDGPVPRPPAWGGYRLAPDSVEFWQGRPSRLHDRLRYRRAAGDWHLERLGP